MKQSTYLSTWDKKTEVRKHAYENIDFTGTDFNHPIFQDVNFINCTFAKCNLDDARTYSCNFYDCTFDRVDLRGVTIGAHGGIFKGCLFLRCNFKRSRFYIPDFIECTFDHCQLKAWEPDSSYFENCIIKGKISEVTFYDTYEWPEGNIRHNLFYSIDFSEAIFGEYVEFDQCDLSLSIPPKGYTFKELLIKEFPSRIKSNAMAISTGAFDNF